jgi:hypothetical protein
MDWTYMRDQCLTERPENHRLSCVHVRCFSMIFPPIPLCMVQGTWKGTARKKTREFDPVCTP